MSKLEIGDLFVIKDQYGWEYKALKIVDERDGNIVLASREGDVSELFAFRESLTIKISGDNNE